MRWPAQRRAEPAGRPCADRAAPAGCVRGRTARLTPMLDGRSPGAPAGRRDDLDGRKMKSSRRRSGILILACGPPAIETEVCMHARVALLAEEREVREPMVATLRNRHFVVDVPAKGHSILRCRRRTKSASVTPPPCPSVNLATTFLPIGGVTLSSTMARLLDGQPRLAWGPDPHPTCPCPTAPASSGPEVERRSDKPRKQGREGAEQPNVPPRVQVARYASYHDPPLPCPSNAPRNLRAAPPRAVPPSQGT